MQFFGIGVNFWPRDVNTEIDTKIVPVRAVNSPIDAFCTEFRCESIRDDDALSDWDREIDHQGQEIDNFVSF